MFRIWGGDTDVPALEANASVEVPSELPGEVVDTLSEVARVLTGIVESRNKVAATSISRLLLAVRGVEIAWVEISKTESIFGNLG